MFKPAVQQFATVIRVQHRVETTAADGFRTLAYQDATPALQFCDAVPYHGAELYNTNRPLARDGMTLTMWYDATVKASDRILLNDDSALAYEVIGPPENVNQREIYMVLKVERMVDA